VQDRLSELMDAAAAGGAYADARFVRERSEYASTRNGEVDELHRDEDEGVGVRVRVGGAWGFAATRDTSKRGAEAALARALAIARAQPRADPTPLAPEPVARGEPRGGEAPIRSRSRSSASSSACSPLTRRWTAPGDSTCARRTTAPTRATRSSPRPTARSTTSA
jgi:predicted Zn-dependent protease